MPDGDGVGERRWWTRFSGNVEARQHLGQQVRSETIEMLKEMAADGGGMRTKGRWAELLARLGLFEEAWRVDRELVRDPHHILGGSPTGPYPAWSLAYSSWILHVHKDDPARSDAIALLVIPASYEPAVRHLLLSVVQDVGDRDRQMAIAALSWALADDRVVHALAANRAFTPGQPRPATRPQQCRHLRPHRRRQRRESHRRRRLRQKSRRRAYPRLTVCIPVGGREELDPFLPPPTPDRPQNDQPSSNPHRTPPNGLHPVLPFDAQTAPPLTTTRNERSSC